MRADAMLPAGGAILASNTSSIPITSLAAVTARPEQGHRDALLQPRARAEARRGDPRRCRRPTRRPPRSSRWPRDLGKTPAEANDFPGFVSNRILMPFINEAAYALMEGVAEAEAIDTIAKLGFAHPLGPLALADLIGLDTCVAIMEVLHEGSGTRSTRRARCCASTSPRAGSGGRAGRGFYDYAVMRRRPRLAAAARRIGERLRRRASSTRRPAGAPPRARSRGARAVALAQARRRDAVACDAPPRARHQRRARARPRARRRGRSRPAGRGARGERLRWLQAPPGTDERVVEIPWVLSRLRHGPRARGRVRVRRAGLPRGTPSRGASSSSASIWHARGGARVWRRRAADAAAAAVRGRARSTRCCSSRRWSTSAPTTTCTAQGARRRRRPRQLRCASFVASCGRTGHLLVTVPLGEPGDHGWFRQDDVRGWTPLYTARGSSSRTGGVRARRRGLARCSGVRRRPGRYGGARAGGVGRALCRAQPGTMRRPASRRAECSGRPASARAALSAPAGR